MSTSLSSTTIAITYEIVFGQHTKSFVGVMNRSGGVMVSVLATSEVDRGFEYRSDHTKDYTIGICFFHWSFQYSLVTVDTLDAHEWLLNPSMYFLTVVTLATSSCPLSDCSILGGPNWVKMVIHFSVTPADLFTMTIY
jgi:hypothetical protein